MKELPNLQLNPETTTVSLLTVALNTPPQQGFDFTAIRARNRVADAIEGLKAGDVIKLEDADYTVAVDAIKGVRWTARSKEILKFAEQFGL